MTGWPTSDRSPITSRILWRTNSSSNRSAIEDAGLAEHDGVLERAAEREAALPQHLDFLQEPERARRRDLVDKRLFGDRIVRADAGGADGRS